MSRLLCVLVLLSASACTNMYRNPIVMTYQTGPDTETDVAWVVADDTKLLRCVNTESGPICQQAKID